MVAELAKVLRADAVESIHYGHACLFSKSGLAQIWGDENFYCFTRSIIKPIQAKVSLIDLDNAVSNEDIAIGSASHSGNEEARLLVRDLLNKFANVESNLKCGTFVTKHKNLESRIHHNCSGKHSLMLAACKKQNYSIDNYDDLKHPLQQKILQELQRLSGKDSIRTAIDGCGLPTFYLAIKDMAKTFYNLITDPDYQRIISAMNQFPFIVGGEEQFDSLLMNKYPNKFLAKGGAEGLMVVCNLEKQESLLIKIIDGSSRAKAFITNKFLEELNWIEKKSIPIDINIYNSRKEIVGTYQ